jgi:hypothetical protein
VLTFAIPNRETVLEKYAEVAQLVEHNLAKVGVARSNRVFCSEKFQAPKEFGIFFYQSRFLEKDDCPGGEIGRHAGLKILFAAMQVRVQVPPGARVQRIHESGSFFI